MAEALSEKEINELIDRCRSAKENAHCLYSEFKVGAALLTKDGQIFTGNNVMQFR